MMSFLPSPLPENAESLEEAIASYEKKAYPLKRNAEAKIIWHDEDHKRKTPFSIVYLHGFRGSHGEGSPVHRTIAENFGCNLYLSRLYGHGQIKVDKLANLTPEKLIRSAEDAYRVGQRIGEKVILMGTSTGAALALNIAASPAFSSLISGLILYSPLVHFYGIRSLLLENSPGRKLLRLCPGENYQVRSKDPFDPDEGSIWYHSYRLNGALALGETIEQVMKSDTFKKVHCPVFIGYYYKNKHEHDRIVSTSAVKRMAKMLGSPSSDVTLKNFPNANSHVICSSLLSDAVQDVIDTTAHFLSEKVEIKLHSKRS